ncbi:MAG TPA: PPC domain-containing protein, partial [Tepidisphaeraceae bacterium]|nr:PPC domain-containing protein [Tepidisphaeraceae bacterium]
MGSAAVAQPVPTASSSLISIQRGQTLEVTVNGSNLSTVASVGIEDPQGLDVALVNPEKPDNAKATLRIVAAPDATPGNREFRLVSPTGVSNPLRVVVDQFPRLAESEPNDAPPQAQTAVLPAVLTGQIGHPGDADCFRFDARKGQCIVFDLHASRDGSPLDAAIAVYDAAGKELASDNDTHGADPFLAFDVPADGPYVLEIRDLQFRGGGEYRYRVKCGHFPYVSALFPITSQRGRVVDVKTVGHNLYGADTVKLDLTYATPGRVQVRVTTPLGVSNALPFEVTDAAPTPEAEPNDAADKATGVPLPADVSGVIAKGDDEDFFRFTVPQKQMVNLEVSARRLGSPVDALLTLRNAKGDVIETNDDAAGADARITRELDPGDYVASVRDLVYAGGPDHAYRLSVEPTLAPPQGFALRFQPDAIRVHRGGHAAVWCDVSRQNGFAGDVTVTLEGLPRGVTASPVTLGPGSSGFFTISAAPDANLGSTPVRLRGSAVVGGRLVSREGEPELNGRPVEQSYLTVLEPAPFAVETPAVLDAPRLQQLAGEIAAVTARLSAPDPALDGAQAEWEKKVLASAVWTPLEFAETTSANGAAVSFAKQPDGSVLVGGTNPDMDNYTLVAHTDVKGIVAVRLEVLSDPALPSKGPGRAVNGNFVLTGLSLLASPKADAAKAQKVSFNKSKATFSQQNYPVEHAVDDERDTGWAIVPQTGRSHTATFFTAAPVGADGGTTLKFQLE